MNPFLLTCIRHHLWSHVWWPHPLTYKGGISAWCRDLVRNYWQHYAGKAARRIRTARCAWNPGHLWGPQPWDEYQYPTPHDKCRRCGAYQPTPEVTA